MKLVYTSIILFISTFSYATDFYKPFIPIFPQVTNGRYFKASVLTGLSAFLAYDISRFETIQKRREEYFSIYDLIWRQNMNEQTGGLYNFETFVPDSIFLGYSRTNSTLYSSYINAKNSKKDVLEAQYTKNINLLWLGGIYTYSFFDALDIYYHKPKENINSTDALIRSIIIPGWGQIYSGSYSQAGLIYGLIIGFSGHAFYANKLTNYYDNSILPDDISKAEKYSTQRTTYLLYMVGVYLYNVVDAYVEGELSNFNLDISAAPPKNIGENISTNLSVNYLF